MINSATAKACPNWNALIGRKWMPSPADQQHDPHTLLIGRQLDVQSSVPLDNSIAITASSSQSNLVGSKP